MQSAKTEDDQFEENAGGSTFKIGVTEYYVAKRAAKKLKAFWQRYKA